MAAGTVTLISPPDTSTGIRLSEPLTLLSLPYTGTGTITEIQCQIATDAGFTAVVYESGLLTMLAPRSGGDTGGIWTELFPDLIPLSASTVYYWRFRTRNSSNETSSWATAFSFTTEAAVVSSAAWTATQ